MCRVYAYSMFIVNSLAWINATNTCGILVDRIAIATAYTTDTHTYTIAHGRTHRGEVKARIPIKKIWQKGIRRQRRRRRQQRRQQQPVRRMNFPFMYTFVHMCECSWLTRHVGFLKWTVVFPCVTNTHFWGSFLHRHWMTACHYSQYCTHTCTSRPISWIEHQPHMYIELFMCDMCMNFHTINELQNSFWHSHH